MLNRYFIALVTVVLFWGSFVMAEDETLFNMNSGGKDIVVSIDGDTVTMSVKSSAPVAVAPASESSTAAVDAEVAGVKAEETVVESVVPESGETSEAIVVAVAPVIDEVVMVEKDGSSISGTNMGMLFFVFILAIFLGVELISKVPSQLHTPLMSGSNAISGITVVGALLAVRSNIANGNERMAVILGVLAVAFAMINVVGGYLVTDRMLGMFKHKD